MLNWIIPFWPFFVLFLPLLAWEMSSLAFQLLFIIFFLLATLLVLSSVTVTWKGLGNNLVMDCCTRIKPHFFFPRTPWESFCHSLFLPKEIIQNCSCGHSFCQYEWTIWFPSVPMGRAMIPRKHTVSTALLRTVRITSKCQARSAYISVVSAIPIHTQICRDLDPSRQLMWCNCLHPINYSNYHFITYMFVWIWVFTFLRQLSFFCCWQKCLYIKFCLSLSEYIIYIYIYMNIYFRLQIFIIKSPWKNMENKKYFRSIQEAIFCFSYYSPYMSQYNLFGESNFLEVNLHFSKCRLYRISILME